MNNKKLASKVHDMSDKNKSAILSFLLGFEKDCNHFWEGVNDAFTYVVKEDNNERC